MTVKELLAGVVLVAGAITGGLALIDRVDARYMKAIERANLDAKVYHLESQAVELQGVRALYDARFEVEGGLSPSDEARRQTVNQKIAATESALRLLQEQMNGL